MEQSRPSRQADFFSDGEVLLGDSAYPLSASCMVPYKRRQANQLTEERRHFNLKLSEIRVKVEHTFGILKNRFPLLQCLPLAVNGEKGRRRVIRWVHACVCLHNALIQWQDGTFPEPEDLPIIEEALPADQIQMNQEGEVNPAADNAAELAPTVVRDELAHRMFEEGHTTWIN